MDLHEVQAVSCTISESELCLFSYQITWVFKKASSKEIEIEYRHFGMLPLQQILLNRRVVSTNASIGLKVDFTYHYEGLKLQIKKYGRHYNLLINGQDFELYVKHLKTIEEIQDEPNDEIPKRSTRRLQSKLFSKTQIGYEGEQLFTAFSSPILDINNEKLLTNDQDENELNQEAEKVLQYLGTLKHEILLDTHVMTSLNNLNDKANRVLGFCTNELLMENLQKIKKETSEIFELHVTTPLTTDSASLKDYVNKSIKRKFHEILHKQKRF